MPPDAQEKARRNSEENPLARLWVKAVVRYLPGRSSRKQRENDAGAEEGAGGWWCILAPAWSPPGAR